MKKAISYFLVFIVLTSFAVLNRGLFTDLVDENLKNYSENDWPEKIYVQIDKPYYSLDDNIWFTGYLVNGITHAKSSKSHVVYVELINGRDSIVGKKRLFTEDISFTGDFKINEDWEQGSYLLRAYTNYMRNGDPNYFFQKELYVLGSDKTGNAPLGEKTDELSLMAEMPDLNFYPEGGHLVENIRSKVAVKIKNHIYSKIYLSCFVTDNENNIVAQFSTTEFGMGFFTFVPEANKSYFANVEVNGSEYKYPLPIALPKGYVLNVTNDEYHFLVNVKSNMPLGLKGTYFVAHQRGHMIFSRLESEDTDDYSLKLPTKDLKDGVVTLTLFDSNSNPVCERLIFVDVPKDKGTIKILKDKETLGKREKIALNISTKDTDGKNLPSQLSMSVRDMGMFPHNNRQENIKTWLLLNSDLRGDIKDPGYFFTKEANYKTNFLLDLVMMTNGWRRFTWQNLLNGQGQGNEFDIEKGITISGTTKLLKKPYTITSAATRLTFLGDILSQEPVQKSNSQGKFSFGPFVFFDSIPMMIESRLTDFQSKELNDRNVEILIDDDNYQSPEVNRNTVLKNKSVNEIQIDNFLKMSEYINQINTEYDKNAERLAEVTVVGKRKEKYEERQEEMNNRAQHGGSANTRIDVETRKLDEYGAFTGLNPIGALVEAMVPGRARFSSLNNNTSAPIYLLNNMKVHPKHIESIPLEMVSFIDVLKPPDALMYTSETIWVIAIFTREGARVFDEKRKPGIIDFKMKGFYTAREFYAPDYSKESSNVMKADFRTTLHWEPTIKTTIKEPTKEISFFTSDNTGDYIIEIEGISDSGIPLHEIMTFSVQ
ncbi:hypothetical protein [Confluentibacter flavum]|uniref:Macroglobulin domain-containing protein n=1 Tax=Confluentibacter flavum TaxID=1909700 RepID=A0A2N3HKR5_9FLAO|nr:hypothetical protein [Confluentibacter flavum]PKQ45537.1 hypothetical protein CSW08_07485 [Confluentibacter flavum]